MTDALAALLRLCARAECDAACSQALTRAAEQFDGWEGLPDAAEADGLAPLVAHHLSGAGAAVPADTRLRLIALAFAHQAASRAQLAALGRILDAFDAAGIRVLVLKGAALAHILYAHPGLRPLGDLDLLVDADQAVRAQSALAALGFTVPVAAGGRRARSHHHLPTMTKRCDGHDVQVEIHTDALTHDAPGSLTIDRLSGAPQAFAVGGRTAHALGHADMVYHLCRHVAEPAAEGRLRLIWVADIVGYVTRYRDAIPWPEVHRRYPFVVSALSLLDLVTPLPRELGEYSAPATARAMRGVGTVSRPPGEIFEWTRPVRDMLRDAFDPSDWWLRLYYGAGAESPVWWCRCVRHPWQVAYWLARRARAVVP